MPTQVRKTASGKYKVSTPGGVKAKATSKAKAEAQARLLHGIDRGWKPTKRKRS